FQRIRQAESSNGVIGLVEQGFAVAGNSGAVVLTLVVKVAYLHILCGSMRVERMELADVGIIEIGVGMGFGVIGGRRDVHAVLLAGAAAGSLGGRSPGRLRSRRGARWAIGPGFRRRWRRDRGLSRVFFFLAGGGLGQRRRRKVLGRGGPLLRGLRLLLGLRWLLLLLGAERQGQQQGGGNQRRPMAHCHGNILLQESGVGSRESG